MKQCRKCGEYKDENAFSRQAKQKDGLFSWCKSCCAARYLAKREAALADAAGAPDVVEFGEQLRAARKAASMTQDEVGALVGVGGGQVRLWEQGKSLPRAAALQKLVDRFSISLPLGVTPNKEGRFPIAVSSCEQCGRAFPVYKRGVKHCSRVCSGKSVAAAQMGAANANYTGGRTRLVSGYVKVKAPHHPNADAGGYVLEHRLVMELHINRLLKRTEYVHHKNGDRADNRIENLELWSTKGKSRKDPPGQRVEDLIEQIMAHASLSGLDDRQRFNLQTFLGVLLH